jgi:hypothetical protein
MGEMDEDEGPMSNLHEAMDEEIQAEPDHEPEAEPEAVPAPHA